MPLHVDEVESEVLGRKLVPDAAEVEPAGWTAGEIQAFLERLVPELGAPVIFRDVDGNEYRTTAKRPVRVQLTAGRRAAVLIDLVFESLGKMSAADGADSIRALVAEITDSDKVDRVIAVLDDLFQILHPDTTPEGALPSDRFALEDMIDAILPFLGAPGAKVAGMLAGGSASTTRSP